MMVTEKTTANTDTANETLATGKSVAREHQSLAP